MQNIDTLSFEDSENQNHTILLVEDDPYDKLLIQEKIKSIRPESDLVIFSSVKELKQNVGKGKFDVIILDLNLNDSFGPQSVQDVREIYKHVPIVVVSSMISNITVDEAMNKGANCVLLKSDVVDNNALGKLVI